MSVTRTGSHPLDAVAARFRDGDGGRRSTGDVLLDNRIIFFGCAGGNVYEPVINDLTSNMVIQQMLYLQNENRTQEISFYINSPGGIVTSGMVIHDTMKMISSPVSTICMGLAASMGSILLSAGAKGKRYIYPSGEVMIHQPSLGGMLRGTSADLEIQAIQIRKTKQIGAKILADNCGKTVEEIMKDFERDYWMDAQEALDYGIVDSILSKL